MNPLVSRTWSPYAAGILIGLLQIPAFLLVGTALGVSSSFVTVAASLLSFVDSTALAIPYFKSHAATAKDWWQVALMGGIVLGAFVSTRIAGTARPAMSAFWPRVAGIRSGKNRGKYIEQRPVKNGLPLANPGRRIPFSPATSCRAVLWPSVETQRRG